MKLSSVAMVAILMASSCAPTTTWNSHPISGAEVESDFFEINNITYDYSSDMVNDKVEVVIDYDAEWKIFVRETLAVHAQKPEHPFWSAFEIESVNNDIVWVDPLSLIDISKLLDDPEILEWYTSIDYRLIYNCSVCHIESVVRWAGKVSVYFEDDDFDWAMRVILCESAGRDRVLNPSSKASGLFQHLPKFWEERYVLANDAGYVNDGDILDPEDNIAVAAWLYYEDGGSKHWNPSKHCWK
tara:strand:- start:22 stop:747 length:726 start_codon:yes stop_codon:yes gene_type:complete